MKNKTEITETMVNEMLDYLKNNLKNVKKYIFSENGKFYVSNEFFAGAFAGRIFESSSYEGAMKKLLEYMYENVGTDSIVGNILKRSGFDDLTKFYNYCKAIGTIKRKKNN